MRPIELKKALKVIRPTRRPVMIWGQPGTAKSSIVHQDIAEAQRTMLDWRLALKDAVDLMGIPNVDKGLTYWNPPAELPRKPGTDIFMDELPQAPIPVTNAATQLILDRRLGGYVLPDDTWIIAAGNLDGDRAATNRMPTHVANRFIHLTLDVHTDDWLEYAEAKGFDPRTFAYVKWCRDHLFVFDPRSKEKAFATPRSWEFASDTLKSLDAGGVKLSVTERLELLSGILGKAVAVGFNGFIEIMDKLVSLEQIKLNPTKVAVPTDAAVLYALSYALVNEADKKTFENIVTYVERMKEEHQFLFMKEIQRKKPDLMKSKRFIGWAAKHQEFA
jgi:hypothetical protein